ncbi:SAC3/GANP/Nin1/mts3/eIF-3 p25 family-domain-containing protein [Syncephalis plumigaleata]|nr:SAC3/GANP/Nin1/mts3/eIF-3 p25 family-domain-containing protein [Syncephalis plumigaleata]
MKGVNRSWRRTDTRLTSVEDEVGTNNNGISGSLTTPTQRRERFEQVPDANRYEMMKQEREKLRQQYIKRGLIQDPDQKIDLRNAIKFVGTCQDMCPAFEREEREYQKSIDKLERRAGTTDRIDHSRAVKTFHRPAAGNEQPLPCDVRPPIILERTLSYLIYDIVMTHGVENTHFFVRDRMRSIRQDYTLQNERGISAITVHEKIARYHIACSHLLCETPSFSESQEMEQLRKVLQSLHEFYDDAAINGLKCENEAEFRSYHLVAHLGDKDILRQAQFYPADIVQSPLVQHALKFHALYQQEGSFQMIDMIRFFRLVAHPTTSFLTACLLEHFFIKIRKSGLAILRNAVNLRQKPSIPVERFVSMFSFTDYTELEEFCQFFGMTLNDNQVILSQDDTSTTSTAVTSAFSTSIPGSASQSPFMTGIGSPFETNDTTSTEKKVNPLPRRKNVQLVTVKMTDSLASYIEQPHFPSDPHAYDVVWPPAILSSTTSFVKQELFHQ